MCCDLLRDSTGSSVSPQGQCLAARRRHPLRCEVLVLRWTETVIGVILLNEGQAMMTSSPSALMPLTCSRTRDPLRQFWTRLASALPCIDDWPACRRRVAFAAWEGPHIGMAPRQAGAALNMKLRVGKQSLWCIVQPNFERRAVP